MKRTSAVVLLLSAVVLTGCYHATVDTGLRPSGEVVEKLWAHGFVYGLVPPSEIDVAAECPDGVARVETQLSFLNQLASALTFGLYTPMTISVACAAGPDRAAMNAGNTFNVIGSRPSPETIDRAIRLAIETRQNTYLNFVDATE